MLHQPEFRAFPPSTRLAFPRRAAPGILQAATAPQRRDLLDILDDRHERRSKLVTSQLPVEHWHKMIGEPTHVDAFLDRLVQNAYRIELKGKSMRKINAKGGKRPQATS